MHVAALGEQPTHDDLIFESKAYNVDLAKLLATAQRFGRLDPASGLRVVQGDRLITIPVELHGFAWTAEDFNQIELVGDYRLTSYARPVRTEGVGVPLLVRRCRTEEERFYRRVQPFSATAVLRMRAAPTMREAGENEPAADAELVLEFYDPANCGHLIDADRRWVLAGDLTAPFAWVAYVEPSSPVKAFLRPDNLEAKAQLVMIEPYQCGKIPVVFVHGLASDPTTWLTQIHSLRAQPWFRERYQVWAFRYPTGMPFLTGAATLRRELQAAVALSPGAAEDPAAQQMVLVGHSLGGLVSKLQATESGTDLWNVAANLSLDEIQASATDRERLREVFFFEPLPFVRKVIFIGTPHRGSSIANQAVGRVSSWSARITSQADERHRRLIAENPDVFAPWIVRKVPTSIDLLQPDHPLLCAVEKLSIGRNVELHSIIGLADASGTDAPGDGVVSLASARHCGTLSEKHVSETHRGLHEAATTTIEIEQILQRQLREIEDSIITESIEQPVPRPRFVD
ncbi:MAG: alpha/beta fold hydrolase [Planctomycetia bacterium]|nr:alpha/beta fold hydrolase [Planctomycetia bacterium]